MTPSAQSLLNEMARAGYNNIYIRHEGISIRREK
nr:MAG TPA: hypothetical protein [Caudoviricetes sp.]